MEKSAGLILFRREDGETLFLLIKNAEHGHWDFPKGHIDPGEDEMSAALRETREECGITEPRLLPGFREVINYDVKSGPKEAVYFLAESPTDRIVLSSEHTDFRWLPLHKAMSLFGFDNTRRLLTAASKRV